MAMLRALSLLIGVLQGPLVAANTLTSLFVVNMQLY